MRIAFVAPRFHTNQADAVRALVQRKVEVVYWVINRGLTEVYDSIEPIDIRMSLPWLVFEHLVPSARDSVARIRWAVPSIFDALCKVHSYRPDVIVVRGDPLRSPTNLMFMVASLGTKARLVVYSQDGIAGAHSKVGLMRALSIWTFTTVCGIHWYSPVTGNGPKPWFSKRMTHVPFVVQPRAASKSNTRRDIARPTHILSVGKYYRRKNHHLLLAALSELSSKHLVLTIVGECSGSTQEEYLTELRALAQSTGFPVLFKQNVPPPQMGQLYLDSDLVVIASTSEPASISNLEAMAHGVPAIVSSTNGMACTIRHRWNGYLFTDGSKTSLKEVLSEALASPERLAAMGQNARSYIEAEHGVGPLLKVLFEAMAS